MKKRILSLCMVAALLFGMLPNIALSVRAETIASGTSEEGFRWELDSEGTLTISGEGAMEDHSPAGAGYGSWVNANVGFHDVKIQKVIISEGITKIGNSAFASCLYLKSVEIPDTVTEIGGWAFLTCEELQEIEIPSSVGLIGNMAFQACEKLEQIVLPEGIPSIGDQTFAYCTNLQSIVIPSSVTSIGTWAFANCDQLRQIYFSGNAPSFGDGTYDYVFDSIIATAYYPANNSTWTADIMQDHGGFITWEPMDGLGNANPTADGPSLFIPVVESRVVECKFDSLSAEKQQECRGILVDLDRDGNNELILRYLDRWDDLIFEVWKIRNGTPNCINTVNLFSGGIGTNGCLSSADYEGKQYLVYQWINSGMDYVNDLSEVYCLTAGKYEYTSSISVSDLGKLTTLMRSNYDIDKDEEPEGTVLDELISLLQSDSDADTNNRDFVDDNLVHFLLKNDGWSFANAAESFAEEPASHADDYFIPRERYDALYGKSYVDSQDDLFTTEWGGNCAGMSATAILFFLDSLDWESIDAEYSEAFSNPNDFYRTVNLHNQSQSYYPAIGNDTEVTRLIEAYQLYVNAIDQSRLVEKLEGTYFTADIEKEKNLFGTKYIRDHISSEAGGTYIASMLKEFQEAYEENNPLLIALQSDGFGHAIVARTDLKPEDMGDGWWRIYVYDPNKPYINESVTNAVSGVEAEPTYTFGCNTLVDNGGDIYLELNPSLNQWRYCTSVNSNSADSYIGSSPSGKLLWKTYYHDATPDNENDDEGKKNNAKIPDFFYTIDLTDLTMEDFANPHFDSTSAWIPENDLAVAVDGRTDCSIYASTGELVAIVEDGDAFVLSDVGSYDAYIGQSEDGGSLGGKIYLPNDVYTVYYTSGAVQFLGSDNALSFSCEGIAELTVDITLNSLQIIAQEDSIAAVKCANVTATDECSYVDTEGALAAGETLTIAYSDENKVEASTNSKDGEFQLYQKDADQEEAVVTKVIKSSSLWWLWIVGGVAVAGVILFILLKKKNPNA